MENNKILRELESLKKEHNIFNNQKKEDLVELEKLIKTKKHSQVVINLDIDEWFKVSSLIKKIDDYDEMQKRCDQFIALKLLDEIKNRNKRIEQMNIKGALDIFETNNEDKYQKVKDNLLSTNDVIKFMELENIKVDRVHFIIDNITSAILTESLLPFLNQEIQFSTSIYKYPGNYNVNLIPNKGLNCIFDEYEYTTYQGKKEGLKNIPKKNHAKVKVKTND